MTTLTLYPAVHLVAEPHLEFINLSFRVIRDHIVMMKTLEIHNKLVGINNDLFSEQT